MERQSQHPSPRGLQTYFKVYLIKTKSTLSIHSLMWRWSLFIIGHYCVWLELASICLSLVFEKTLQMAKKLIIFVEGITHLESKPVDFRAPLFAIHCPFPVSSLRASVHSLPPEFCPLPFVCFLWGTRYRAFMRKTLPVGRVY